MARHTKMLTSRLKLFSGTEPIFVNRKLLSNRDSQKYIGCCWEFSLSITWNSAVPKKDASRALELLYVVLFPPSSFIHQTFLCYAPKGPWTADLLAGIVNKLNHQEWPCSQILELTAVSEHISPSAPQLSLFAGEVQARRKGGGLSLSIDPESSYFQNHL